MQIPSDTTYKGTKYKIKEIADHNYYSHFGPAEWDSEDSIDGKEVGINLPEYRGYSYFDLPSDLYDFNMAENIKTVILPGTLNYIAKGVFCGMPKLEKVVFADKYKKLTVGTNAFSDTKLKSITFPKGIYELKQCAAGSIPTIYIPSCVTKIGPEVVNADTKKVVISKKNKTFKIKNRMLYSYNEKKLLGASANVKSVVTVSKKTRNIARNVFSRTKVKQVNLNQINTIPTGAFAYCKKLTKVTETKAVSKVNYAAFA
ncbi:MAG: leucine-rich repeat domain-containing protein [Lachnospiraceae bacterium]|nr:leucine-rich repeat domain-containing protein [Lachnospiraceae bacterium]